MIQTFLLRNLESPIPKLVKSQLKLDRAIILLTQGIFIIIYVTENFHLRNEILQLYGIIEESRNEIMYLKNSIKYLKQ